MPYRGVSKRLSFHHNLGNGLFPLEIYRTTNPEFFPLIGGERFLPKSVERHKWQPCFTNPAVVSEAVNNITEYFDKHPEAVSFSLGINDTGADRWCQCGNRSQAGDGFFRLPGNSRPKSGVTAENGGQERIARANRASM
jgi:hypothetical protein